MSCGENPKNENIYDFEYAKGEILKNMAHIIRNEQQSRAKLTAMQSIQTDESSALLIRYWSQKVLEMKYREGQNTYFGKSGMSLHIDVFVFFKNGKFQKASYATIVHRCKQGMIDVLDVSKLVLQTFHKDCPTITKIYCKSNAGCYTSNG